MSCKPWAATTGGCCHRTPTRRTGAMSTTTAMPTTTMRRTIGLPRPSDSINKLSDSKSISPHYGRYVVDPAGSKSEPTSVLWKEDITLPVKGKYMHATIIGGVFLTQLAGRFLHGRGWRRAAESSEYPISWLLLQRSIQRAPTITLRKV